MLKFNFAFIFVKLSFICEVGCSASDCIYLENVCEIDL